MAVVSLTVVIVSSPRDTEDIDQVGLGRMTWSVVRPVT